MIGMIALGAQAAGTLLSSYGAWKAGADADEASKINARLLYDSAEQELEMAKIRLARQKRYTEQFRGTQMASIVHAGGSLDDPTAQVLMKDTEKMAAFDEWLIKFGGAQAAYEKRTAAAAERFEGRTRKQAGRLQAFTSLLTGGAELYTMGNKTGKW